MAAAAWISWLLFLSYALVVIVSCLFALLFLSMSYKEKLLGKNAVDFFELKNLPQPNALKIARQSWNGGQAKAAMA